MPRPAALTIETPAVRRPRHTRDRASQGERASGPVIVGHPAAAAELDGQRPVAAIAKLLEVTDVRAPRGEPVRELKQDAAELARRDQRRQRLRLHLPDQLLRLLRDVTQVDAALLRHGRRQQLLHRSRQPLDDHRVMREQAERLDVEDEAGRRSSTQRCALRSDGSA